MRNSTDAWILNPENISVKKWEEVLSTRAKKTVPQPYIFLEYDYRNDLQKGVGVLPALEFRVHGRTKGFTPSIKGH
jgi:hypothetical protein